MNEARASDASGLQSPMNGPLHSDDEVTRVLHGLPVDFVPVAVSYEGLGPLQYLRTERHWQLWRRRLDGRKTDMLPVSYEMYVAHRLEIETEILSEIYLRPAWTHVPHCQTAQDIAGCAVVRQGEDLFWVQPDGQASWIAPTLQGEEARIGSRWSDLWDRGETEEVVGEAAAEFDHLLQPVPEPTPEQVEAVAGSQAWDLAKALAERFKDELPQYVVGISPYNRLPYRLGFQALMYAMTEMPEKLHQILQGGMPQPSARLAAARSLGISLMFVEECMASADIISPKMYQEFAYEYDRPALQFYEDMGFRTALYFSGNLMPLLRHLKELPFTALFCEEDRKNYGIDLGEVRRAVGPDKVLFGNLDALFVQNASDEDLLSEVKRQINVGGPRNFILSLGSPMTPGTTLERVRLVTESTRRI